MPATTFKTPLNNVSTTVGALRGVGVTSLTVATGTGSKFGSPSPSAPIRITVIQAAGISGGIITDPTKLTIFSATGRSGDVLSGLTVIEGTTDLAFAVNDTVIMAPTAGAFSDIHGAINTLETTTALDSAVVHLAGPETITGAKTFNGGVTVGSLDGVLKGTTGVVGTAAAGTDYLAPFANQSANVVYAGPSSGGAASPAFRAIVAADVPNLDAAKITTGTMAVARLPTMVGSGASHAAGIAPDPGAVAGTAKFLREDATWATPATGGTPGGSDTQVQVNTAGAFGGDAGLTYNASTDTLTILGAADGRRLIIQAAPAGQTTNIVEVKNATGTVMISVAADGTPTFPNGSSLAGIYCYGAAILNPGAGGAIQFGAQGVGAIPLTLSSGGSGGGNTVTVLVTCSNAAENILTVRGLASQTGDLQRWQDNTPTTRLAVDKAGRLVSSAATPSIAAGTGAATTPTVSVAGSDQAGTINVTTGTTPTAAATIVTVTFATAYGVAPKAVLLTPANALTAALAVAALPYEDSSVRAAASFVLKANGTALAASSAYKWNYLVLG
jgi:hypothetical protein